MEFDEKTLTCTKKLSYKDRQGSSLRDRKNAEIKAFREACEADGNTWQISPRKCISKTCPPCQVSREVNRSTFVCEEAAPEMTCNEGCTRLVTANVNKCVAPCKSSHRHDINGICHYHDTRSSFRNRSSCRPTCGAHMIKKSIGEGCHHCNCKPDMVKVNGECTCAIANSHIEEDRAHWDPIHQSICQCEEGFEYYAGGNACLPHCESGFERHEAHCVQICQPGYNAGPCMG